ncbi:hypothetical protein AgCh_018700 [Apium graveolens]
MVVTVMRHWAGRGNRASRGGRGNGGGRGNYAEGGRGNSSNNENERNIPLSPYFERADRSVSTGAVDSVGKPRTQFFDDGYYRNVLDEFKKYYDFEQGVPVEVARAKVKAHLKTNLKSMISWELKQANKRVQNSAPGTRRYGPQGLAQLVKERKTILLVTGSNLTGGEFMIMPSESEPVA